jgi:hypothetical protein
MDASDSSESMMECVCVCVCVCVIPISEGHMAVVRGLRPRRPRSFL